MRDVNVNICCPIGGKLKRVLEFVEVFSKFVEPHEAKFDFITFFKLFL